MDRPVRVGFEEGGRRRVNDDSVTLKNGAEGVRSNVNNHDVFNLLIFINIYERIFRGVVVVLVALRCGRCCVTQLALHYHSGSPRLRTLSAFLLTPKTE